MTTKFIHLNKEWNAEPNAPHEQVELKENFISLTFYPNPWAYEGFEEGKRVEIRFYGCSRWRLGKTNDEGWFLGRCRFSKIAPKWGEFYEVKGDCLLEECPADWQIIKQEQGSRHFLFYLKDSTFECDAMTYEFIKLST